MEEVVHFGFNLSTTIFLVSSSALLSRNYRLSNDYKRANWRILSHAKWSGCVIDHLRSSSGMKLNIDVL
jgi:hypothetical protein